MAAKVQLFLSSPLYTTLFFGLFINKFRKKLWKNLINREFHVILPTEL